MPEIWRRLEAVGLSTTEACGDTPRVILGSPVAGIAADEIIDGTPAIDAIQRAVHRLARVLQPAPQVQDGDQRLAPAGRRARGQRHLVRRRGSPRARPRLRPLGRRWACRRTRCWPSGSARGSRSTRSPTSGPASSASSATTATAGCAPARGSSSSSPTGASSGSARCSRTSTSAARLVDGPPPPVPYGSRDHVGVHRQKDGRYYVGLAPTVGRVSGTTLVRLADLAEAHGSTAGPDHAAPEARRPRRARPTGSTRWSTRPPGSACAPAEHLPPRHDGLHRHRVLQAGDRRDQDPRGQAHRRARAPTARLRRAALDQRQRLPELVRPGPGRRHRAQGPARPGRRRQAGRGLPGAPRRRRSASTPGSAASCAGTR